MLDIKNLRENFNDIKKMLSRRGFNLNQDKFESLDEKRKILQVSVENLQADRKKLSSESVSYTHLTLPTKRIV